MNIGGVKDQQIPKRYCPNFANTRLFGSSLFYSSEFNDALLQENRTNAAEYFIT